jgi:hypothetical protein
MGTLSPLILVGQSPSSAAERDMKLFIDSADPGEMAAKTGLNFLESPERIQHPMTDKGLAAFLEDAKRASPKLKAE